MIMSDTPRTDDAKWDDGGPELVMADFARQLERELTRLQNEVAAFLEREPYQQLDKAIKERDEAYERAAQELDRMRICDFDPRLNVPFDAEFQKAAKAIRALKGGENAEK